MTTVIQTRAPQGAIVGRRRRRNNVNVVVNTQRPVQPNQQNGNARTRRNRRRNQRRRALARMNNAFSGNAPVLSYYQSLFQHVDPTMELSVHKLLQTFFYPEKGIHRGISDGLDVTALSYYQGSFEIATTATLPVVNFNFSPTELAASGTYTPGISAPFFIWNQSVGVTSPVTTTGGYAVAGPFYASNPASAWRVVSATLTLIPASTVLNRGGEGKLAYANDGYNSQAGRSTVDNYTISRSWDGVQSMIMHWVPSDNEWLFSTLTGTQAADGIQSSLCGYVVLPLGTVSAWRVEWQVGIEYLPTPLYRPLVDRQVPLVRPDARYFANGVIQKHWTPLMISTYDDYLRRMRLSTALDGHKQIHYMDRAGMGGVGFVNPAGLDTADAWVNMDEEEFKDDGITESIMNSVTKSACGFMEGMTGEDVCGQPLSSLSRLTGRAANHLLGRTRRNDPYALRY